MKKQSKWYINQLVLCLFDWFHWYLYWLLIIFFHVLFLPIPLEKKQISNDTDHNIGHLNEYTSSSTALTVFREGYHNILKGKCYMMQILLLWLDSYHWYFLMNYYLVLMIQFLQYKIMEKHSILIIFHTGCKCWTQRLFKGQDDCW